MPGLPLSKQQHFETEIKKKKLNYQMKMNHFSVGTLCLVKAGYVNCLANINFDCNTFHV